MWTEKITNIDSDLYKVVEKFSPIVQKNISLTEKKKLTKRELDLTWIYLNNILIFHLHVNFVAKNY